MGRSKTGILLDDHLQSRDRVTLAPAQGLKGQSRSHRPTPPPPNASSSTDKRKKHQRNHAQTIGAFMRSKLGDRRTNNQSDHQSPNVGSVIYAPEHGSKEETEGGKEQE